MKAHLDGSVLVGLLAGISGFVSSIMEIDLAAFGQNGLFKDIFYSLDFPMAIVGTNGKPMLVNSALERVLEFSESELQRMEFREFTHPADVETDAQLFQEIMEGKRDRYSITKRWITKRGYVVWGLLNVTSIRGNNNDIIAVTASVKPLNESTAASVAPAAKKDTKTMEPPKKDGFIITALREIALIKNPFSVVFALTIVMLAIWLFFGGGMKELLLLIKELLQ